MHNAAKSIEQRIEGLGEIKALENVSAIRFKQSKAFELHNPYPIIGEEGNRNFGDNVLFKSLLPNSYRANVALTEKMVLENNSNRNDIKP